jgi:hypothetical protein
MGANAAQERQARQTALARVVTRTQAAREEVIKVTPSATDGQDG